MSVGVAIRIFHVVEEFVFDATHSACQFCQTVYWSRRLRHRSHIFILSTNTHPAHFDWPSAKCSQFDVRCNTESLRLVEEGRADQLPFPVDMVQEHHASAIPTRTVGEFTGVEVMGHSVDAPNLDVGPVQAVVDADDFRIRIEHIYSFFIVLV